MSQDGSGFPQVCQHDADDAAAGQQRTGMHVHDRVMAGVDDAVPGRDTGADVDDLPDSRLAG